MRDILCPDCAVKDLGDRELKEYLEAFVRDMNPDERVSDEVYAARLTLCRDCAERVTETCALCGCFVRARAAKKRMACPKPGKPEWDKAE